MTRMEVLSRLQSIIDKGTKALALLEAEPLTDEVRSEVQDIVQSLKEEIRDEHNRMLPERIQRTLSLFEISIYSPTIEETWKKSGIGRLKTTELPNQRWKEPLEAVVYHAGKYLS